MTEQTPEKQDNILLEVKSHKKYFPIRKGFFKSLAGYVKAVDGVNFFIREGDTMGLVGESGCGKSTTGRTILQLYKPTSGKVLYNGKDLAHLKEDEMRRHRRDLEPLDRDLDHHLHQCAQDPR